MAGITQSEIIRIIRSKERAEKNIAFIDSLKMDTQNIEGTKYKFRFNEKPNNQQTGGQ